MTKRVIIWSTKVQDLIIGKPVGGITVQLFFWAKVFQDNGWNVFSLTKKKDFLLSGISFIQIKIWPGVFELLHEWLRTILLFIRYRPHLVVFRGAQRELLPLVIIGRILHIKVVFFSASDVNFKIGEEQVFGHPINLKMYRLAVKKAKVVVVQNSIQQDTLLQNYGKKSLRLSNIWDTIKTENHYYQGCDVIWVANFRKLKRPEWIMEVAKKLPNVSFWMVGDAWGEENYYNHIKTTATDLKNVFFWGGKSFFESEAMISQSKLLVCTSVFEGFPNTFLQAWSHNIPVISTVNPNSVITDYGLGAYVTSIHELEQQIRFLLSDQKIYFKIKRNIGSYFENAHNSQKGYELLMDYLEK